MKSLSEVYDETVRGTKSVIRRETIQKGEPQSTLRSEKKRPENQKDK